MQKGHFMKEIFVCLKATIIGKYAFAEWDFLI